MLFSAKIRRISNALFFIFSIILFFNGCSKDVPPTGVKGDSGFAVYLLKNQSLKFYDIYNKPVATLELMSKPWLTSSDIQIYDFSSHGIYLKGSRAELFKSRNGIPAPQMNSPFVVTVNGKAIYAGYFTSPASSYMAGAPSIGIDELIYTDDIISIENYGSELDCRDDESIKNVFLKNGKYQGGVKAVISDVEIINGDTALVKYTLSLTNNCSFPIYVLDAEKTGKDLFHYFTNGPVFYNNQNNKSNWAQYNSVRAPSPYNLVLPEWFTLLQANETITRKISLKGYPRFEKGDYKVSMIYSNPIIPKREDRMINKNNIWYGSTKTNIVYFNLN